VEDGFIQGFLNAGNNRGAVLEVTSEEQLTNKDFFVTCMRLVRERQNISLDKMYIADQTGVFFNKLPQHIGIYIYIYI
jgi:hypothetical protein